MLATRSTGTLNRFSKFAQRLRADQRTLDMTDLLISAVLGLGIGFACRWFDLPLPAPPKLVGALLVVAITLGFLGVDHAMGGRS